MAKALAADLLPTLAERIVDALNVDRPDAKALQEEFRPKWRSGRVSMTEALSFLDRMESPGGNPLEKTEESVR